jgi:hypothetical protein
MTPGEFLERAGEWLEPAEAGYDPFATRKIWFE